MTEINNKDAVEKDKHGTSKVVKDAIEETIHEIMGCKIGNETFYELWDKILKTHYIIPREDNPEKWVEIVQDRKELMDKRLKWRDKK